MTEESLVHKALDYDTSKEKQECHFLPREEGTCLWDVLFTCGQSQSGNLNENFPEIFAVMFPIILSAGSASVETSVKSSVYASEHSCILRAGDNPPRHS